MYNFYDKSDSDLKRDVINELKWDPSVDSTQIKVSSNDGIITLKGTVPHYIEKMAAEQAAQRVGGVRAVADELEVKGKFDKTDEEIARAAVNSLKWNYSVPADIKVAVDKGWITLSGEVEWDYQRTAAKNTVGELLGVSGVMNSITIKSKVQPADIKSLIEDAFKRTAESEGKKINVAVRGDTVILTGSVQSFSEIEDARHAAWMAPGVMTVENKLTVAQ